MVGVSRQALEEVLNAAAEARAIREHATSSNGVGGFGPTPTIDPVFSSDIETMTPTDNLEAGAGDLVERLRAGICVAPSLTGDGSHIDIPATEALLREAAAQLAAANLRAELAQEAEDEAKDSFWAIYPEWVALKGHGISTEAARTMLAERAIAAEAENARLREALEKTTK